MKTVGLLREIPGREDRRVRRVAGRGGGHRADHQPDLHGDLQDRSSRSKAGNAHRHQPASARQGCTCETAELLHRAAVEAGAPEGIIQCLTKPTLEGTQALMRHERTAVILATGGSGMVRAAYSSGKPAFGVGPGNVPVLLDRSADVAEAVAKVVQGKSFDYGTVCSSEQSLVAEESLREPILAELKARKALPLRRAAEGSPGQASDHARRAASTRSAWARRPRRSRRWRASRCRPTPPSWPSRSRAWAGSIRSRRRSSRRCCRCSSSRDFDAALDTCEAVLRFGGLGHTAVIHAKDEARIREYARRMPAMRVMVNTPSPQGSVGITTNLLPSMTLGCGAVGGNSTSDNVGPLHLINIKRLAYAVRRPEEAFQIPAGQVRRTPRRPKSWTASWPPGREEDGPSR